MTTKRRRPAPPAPVDSTRPHQVALRLTSAELAAWTAAASADGRTLSQWIRLVVSREMAR